MTNSIAFTARTDFKVTNVWADDVLAASFTDDPAGRAAYAMFIESAARAGHSVLDMDAQEYLAGHIGQLGGATLSQLFGA
jgi:hypothetical protein